jgi:N-acetyl-D-muramate 6-phosphate phosphatase
LTGKNLPRWLQSGREYHIANHQSRNWQDLYINYYGLTETEMLKAGSMWAEYQLRNSTPVQLFPVIEQVIHQIDLPHGICSQNAAENILRVLEKNRLAHKFKAIVGYNDIPHHLQKPASYGGVKCIDLLLENPVGKTVIYLGDHETDVLFARNIEKELQGTIKVLSLIVTYSGADTKHWTHKPDFEIKNPNGLLEIINHCQ